MQSSIIINGVEASVGHTELENICWALEDCSKNTDILHELASSGFVEIRKHVASYQNLRPDTFSMLLEDTSIDVLRLVVSNDEAMKWINEDHIKRYLDIGDTEMMTALASEVGFYTNEQEVCNLNWLCEKLSNHPDPGVRFALAKNDDVPEYLLIKLLEDEDFEVAEKAKETLTLFEADELDELEDD